LMISLVFQTNCIYLHQIYESAANIVKLVTFGLIAGVSAITSRRSHGYGYMVQG
jgi:hypothetical protein